MTSKPSSTPLRLGAGELTDPFGEEARLVAQHEFVEALHRLAPEVIRDLAESVRPFLNLLTRTWASDRPPLRAEQMPAELNEMLSEYHRRRESEYGCGEEAYPFYCLPDGTIVIDLPDAILTSYGAEVLSAHLAWAKRWNLGDEHESWIVQAAGTTYHFWMKQTLMGDGPDGRFYAGPYVQYADRGQYPAAEARRLIEPASHERSFTLPVQDWNLRDEPKSDAFHRIMAGLGRTVRDELDRIEAEALARGDRPVVVKPAAREHVEWLVRYQVKGEPYATIARDVGRSRQAVMLAVRQTAELIKIRLREPDRRGRPRKPTTPRIVKVRGRHSELHN